MPPSPTGLIPPASGTSPDDQPPVSLVDTGYGEAGPDDDTTPIPVILHGSHTGGQEPADRPPSPAAASARLRGPFEPASRTDPAVGGGPAGQPGSESTSAPAFSTLEQIKDLYLTAEAIGETALDKHFELVSDRQRKLIREYFDQVVEGRSEGQDHADRAR